MFVEDSDPGSPIQLMAMAVIEMLEIMNSWTTNTTEIMSTLITRNQLLITRSQLLMANPSFQLTDDKCQAFILWDCEASKGVKSILNTLLSFYIKLEKMVLKVTESVTEHHRG